MQGRAPGGVGRPRAGTGRGVLRRGSVRPNISRSRGSCTNGCWTRLNERGLLGAGEPELAAEVRAFVERVLETEDMPLNEEERRRLADDLLEETLGVGPLAPLMADPAVTDILVNRFDQVYIERFGKLERHDVRFRDTDHLVRIIQRIAARVGRRIDETLADGRRAARRRQPRERHAAARDARRPDPFDSPLRPPPAAARRPAAARHVLART